MIQPINKHVVIKDCPPQAKSAGGILLPETLQQNKNEAIVVATDKGADVKAGDKVIYNDATAEFMIDGVVHRILPEENILCVLES